jgi:NAD-dependent dihydropyrimidine dehydrogenase PreA subunit
MTRHPVILLCKCSHYKIIPDNVRSHVLAALEDTGIRFEAVDDLCRLAARKDPQLKRWAASENLGIAACFPRAVKSLFNAAGAPLTDTTNIFNMRTEDPQTISAQLLQDAPQGACKTLDAEQNDKWIPWFPVIDYDRCINCKQCLNFCLFGVYELIESKVTVAKPTACKTNCPACAKMCPQSAIIFPKYADAPVNGAEVDDNGSAKQTQQDLSDLLSGNIHEAIRRRGIKQLDIPADVLASLTPQDIALIKQKEAAGE